MKQRLHPREEAIAMRSLAGLYLTIGIVLLIIGFVAVGPCQRMNGNDVVGDVVFVLGWPVYLYDNVAHEHVGAPQWLHRQACEGGRTIAYHTAALTR
jgi:hypothetical protein